MGDMSNDSTGPEDTAPIARTPGDSTSSADATREAAADHTRPLPPFQARPETASSSTATAPAPKRRLAAGVLAGALVLGGAAGFGGAAAYDAVNGDSTTTTSGGTTTSTGGGVITADTSSAKAGTVESVAQKVLPSVVKINVTGSSESGSGSGIVLTKDGQILTNNHVVSLAGKSGSITVVFNDGTTAKATVLGTDALTDTAVIKAQGVSNLTPATIGDSNALKVGQQVVAVGAPFGLQATVTSGIVSALDRPVSVSTSGGNGSGGGGSLPFDPFGGGSGQSQQSAPDLSTTYPAIQTDAAINPGNSGGPLVDMAGRVVGINSSIRTSSSTADEGGSIGLGFAIPMTEVTPIINQIAKGETATHARLGVTVRDSSSDALQQGAEVVSVDGSGAADGVLQKGDVVTKVDDQVIDGSESLVATVRGHRPGDKVTLTFIRDKKTQTATVSLGTDANSQQS